MFFLGGLGFGWFASLLGWPYFGWPWFLRLSCWHLFFLVIFHAWSQHLYKAFAAESEDESEPTRQDDVEMESMALRDGEDVD